MKAHQIILAAAAAMMLFPVASRAHEVPNIPHTHAFQQTGYGTYRQGHTVNNQYWQHHHLVSASLYRLPVRQYREICAAGTDNQGARQPGCQNPGPGRSCHPVR